MARLPCQGHTLRLLTRGTPYSGAQEVCQASQVKDGRRDRCVSLVQNEKKPPQAPTKPPRNYEYRDDELSTFQKAMNPREEKALYCST